MFKLKTIILILLLAVIAYQIYKLYSYNFNIVNTSQKILLNSIEKHNNEIMNRIQL
jgi:positive regulator of sigma E activity